MSTTPTCILTLVFLAGIARLVRLSICLLRNRHISVKGAIAMVVHVAAVGVGIRYFAPRSLDGYHAVIMQQNVSWHGAGNASMQPACA